MNPAALSTRSAHVTEVNHKKHGRCKTLVGTYPKYFDNLYFSDEKVAKEAKKEANRVLETGQVSKSKFTRAWNAKESSLI
jgi:hypothetical protein